MTEHIVSSKNGFSKPVVQWDDMDTFYLANSLSIDQLKDEISSTKRTFPYKDWHEDYIRCCQEAIHWIQARQLKSLIKHQSKFIDTYYLKSHVDILEIASRYTKLKKCGRKYMALCPLHNEKTPSFFIYPETQTWHCFGSCNTGGDVITLVMKTENLDFKDALYFLEHFK
jgi:hypothetical protein